MLQNMHQDISSPPEQKKFLVMNFTLKGVVVACFGFAMVLSLFFIPTPTTSFAVGDELKNDDDDNRVKVTEGVVDEYAGYVEHITGKVIVIEEVADEYARYVERITGVDHAILISTIAIESNFGNNTGDEYYIGHMHPMRDQRIFPQLTASILKKKPESVGVSPRHNGNGWGGAMGIAQVLPSTWVCYGGFINTLTESCKMDTVLLTRNLSLNDNHDEVKNLQRFLNQIGFLVAQSKNGSPGNETNSFGPATKNALKKFQKSFSLHADGVLNYKTRRAINKLHFSIGPWYYDSSRDRIMQLLKKHNLVALNDRSKSNPWVLLDAFAFIALYLQDLGFQKDRSEAIRRYHAGRSYKTPVAWTYLRKVENYAKGYRSQRRSS